VQKESACHFARSDPTSQESSRPRRLLRTLRQLDDKQLSAVGYMARTLAQPEAR
jgi:hypothetical protein